VGKSKALLWGLAIGSFMTLSRGPWIGLACGIALASIGTAVDPARRLRLVATIAIVGGITLYFGGKAYVAGVGLGSTENSEEQESAAYRAILIDQYVQIALQKSFWGWGRDKFPTVGGMRSIDNHYLYLTLQQGLVGLCGFAAMLVTCVGRLLKSCVSRSVAPQEREFQATMLGVVVSFAVCISSVFLGGQLYPLLFFCLGWSEGSLLFMQNQNHRVISSAPVSGFQFRSVLA
jgi:O-antigen ligase